VTAGSILPGLPVVGINLLLMRLRRSYQFPKL
jgi:hypothetical protein